ncbi:unnamed protein product [Cladocopium goreaui]|uniref:Uncharacterized protein n=1 Tax=Cladocopium goreaui TaxID=2562237 RepID=A0A9P1CVC1_9DINO|nr:unnamed protein product [Cladocopium goreaui]
MTLRVLLCLVQLTMSASKEGLCASGACDLPASDAHAALQVKKVAESQGDPKKIFGKAILRFDDGTMEVDTVYEDGTWVKDETLVPDEEIGDLGLGPEVCWGVIWVRKRRCDGDLCVCQVEDREGRYRCTLLLPDRALQHLPGLSKHEFHGKACDSAKEAGKSAADAFLGRSYFTGDSTILPKKQGSLLRMHFWDDPILQEIAQNLRPSKKVQRQKKRCAERNVQRDAKCGGKGVDPSLSETQSSLHMVDSVRTEFAFRAYLGVPLRITRPSTLALTKIGLSPYQRWQRGGTDVERQSGD